MIRNFLLKYFDLRFSQETESKVLEGIETGCNFRGVNSWALIAAIIIASIGLNVNSTAVIIGAMLISPLLGPLIGMGTSIAIFDFELLKFAFRQYLIFVAISLTTSTLFFLVSPMDEVTPELLMRTYPSIYDVLIAFFGGLAGIIAFTRKDRISNIIPGVAIATALMPPLCTAGYGIANFNFPFLAGSLYLFIINSVMIAMATFLVVKFLLRFSLKEYPDQHTSNKVKNLSITIVIVTILPSIYLAYNLVTKSSFERKANDFIESEIVQKNIPVISRSVSFSDNQISLFLIAGSDDTLKNNLEDKLRFYDLGTTKLILQSAEDYYKEGQNKYTSVISDKDNLILSLRDTILKLRNTIDNTKAESQYKLIVLKELKAINPSVLSFNIFNKTDSLSNLIDSVMEAVVVTKTEIDENEGQALRRFIIQRTGFDTVNVFFLTDPSNLVNPATKSQRKRK